VHSSKKLFIYMHAQTEEDDKYTTQSCDASDSSQMVSFEDDEEGSYMHIGDVDPKETLGSDYDDDVEEATTEHLRTVKGSSQMVNLEEDEVGSSYLHIKNIDPKEALGSDYDYDVEEAATTEHLHTISGSSRMVNLDDKGEECAMEQIEDGDVAAPCPFNSAEFEDEPKPKIDLRPESIDDDDGPPLPFTFSEERDSLSDVKKAATSQISFSISKMEPPVLFLP
jgi:hypothetical protein